MMSRGKLVTIGGQRRFFPAVHRDPGGALDAAIEHEHEPTLDERERALDAREAALDELEAADDEGKTDEEAGDRKRARDSRRAARIKRARDWRRGARDGEWLTRSEHEAAEGDKGRRRSGRDALPDHDDHRRDFRSGSADSMARDSAGGRVDIEAIFGTAAHQRRSDS